LQQNIVDVFNPPDQILLSGGHWGTVPELLFEKKYLISALQQLLVSYSRTA
jgi:hypothetical protein